MAKRKGSVALFEVINKGSQRGGGLPTPAWMHKGKLAPAVTRPVMVTTPVRNEPNPGKTEPAPVAKTPRALDRAVDKAPKQSKTPVQALPTITESGMDQPDADHSAPDSAGIHPDAGDSWPVVAQREDFAPIGGGPVRRRGRRPLRLTSTGVAVIGSCVTLVLGMVLITWHFRHHESPAQVALAGPAHPEVLNVAAPRTTAKPNGPVASNTPSPVKPSSAKLAAAVQTPQRQAAAYFVVLCRYENQKTADLVSAYLNTSGVNCTVEHGLPGLPAQLYAVVGLMPFSSVTSPEYAAYVSQVRLAVPKIPGGLPNVKTFRPQPVKWAGAARVGVAG
jgi:hypothetical protein